MRPIAASGFDPARALRAVNQPARRSARNRATLAARAATHLHADGARSFDHDRTNRTMTSSNQTPATVSSSSRKSLTLIQFLSLIAFGGVAASLLLKLFV
ncbi:hypothetical protein [Paraburkholderia caballeronis]|nr:hypothetical protein [Paraburkholderia caballeronis]